MNIGVCRKGSTGVMCPSYMATREEEHSTRGRANALVQALSQPDPRAALGDERLHDILDLCLECKACKSECPLGVDMASMKSEFLFQYQGIHGVPRRARFFAAARRLNRVGAAMAPLSNLVWALPGARAAMERTLGVSRRRPLPRFQRRTLLRWFAGPTRPAATLGRVVMLADSFTTFTEPGVGIAAVELLEMAGWEVDLVGDRCCGRAAISKGLLDDAAHQAQAMTARLIGLARQGVTVVGVEPSCILTLTEEHLALQPDSDDAKVVAGQVRLVDDLVLEAIDAGHLRLDPASALGGPADPLPRPLPPEGAGGHGSDGAAAVADPRCHRGGGGRRLLRHGGVVRLRGRALRPLHADRGDAPVPRGQRGGRRHPHRRHRRVVPPADRPRHGTRSAPPR